MAKGISIHIGLNDVDVQHYGEDVTPLSTCEQDAKDMQKIALKSGFSSSHILLTESATRQGVKNLLLHASGMLELGDTLFLTYSGHGGSVRDTSGDEKDHLDETWCLYDGQLLDDELKELWCLFRKGVRVVVLSDSCHSGSVTKAPQSSQESELFQSKQLSAKAIKYTYYTNQKQYDDLNANTPLIHDEDIVATVQLLSACQDVQVSYTLSLADNSIFTEKLKEVWDDGRFSGSYTELFEETKLRVTALDFLPTTQTPNFLVIGNSKFDFRHEEAFKV